MKVPGLLKNIIQKMGKSEHVKQMTPKEKWMLFLLTGLLLAVILFPTGDKENNVLNNSEKVSGRETVSAELGIGMTGINSSQYEIYLSQKLEEILSEIDGAGKVQAWVTLAGSSEKVLIQEKDEEESLLEEADSVGGVRKEEKNNVDETVIKNSNGDPYVVKTLQPEVEGVLVVAEGGGNSVVKKNISEAVEVLFGIDAHRIKVAKKKMEE